MRRRLRGSCRVDVGGLIPTCGGQSTRGGVRWRRRPKPGIPDRCRKDAPEQSAPRPRPGDRLVRRVPSRPEAPNTLVTAEALLEELAETRRRGFGIHDQENEIGVNCVAIPIHLDGSATPSGAISVSAVTFRCPLERLVDAVPDIRQTIARMLGPKALG